MIELVSRGNKDRPEAVRRFARKVAGLVRKGVHAAVIDPHRPGRHDPGGMAAAVCRSLRAEPPDAPPAGRPVTFAAFRASPLPPRVFLDDLAAGDSLPATPLFLDDGAFVSLPLEDTYTRAVAALDPSDLPPPSRP